MLKVVAFISGCRKFLCVMSGPSRTIHVTLFNDLRVRSKYLRDRVLTRLFYYALQFPEGPRGISLSRLPPYAQDAEGYEQRNINRFE